MRTTPIVLLACACLAGGCNDRTGWLLQPVPVDKSLEETVVSRDRGLFVTDKVAIVHLGGLLLNERQSGLFGDRENPVSLFVEQLDKAQADDDVKAVILRINSPGGSVTASDIMYNRLLRFRENKGVPVIAIIEDVGASGAYYVACGADAILCHPTGVTGSIGVVVQTFSLAGTMKLIGIEAKAVTSGQYKDMLNPLKPLQEDELTLVQGMVDIFYERFVNVVDRGRAKLSAQQIRKLADGRVYAGEQALANGLVDVLGYMDDAVALAKGCAGVARAKVVVYHRPLAWRPNAYASGASLPAAAQINLLNLSAPESLGDSRPRFLYLWTTAGR